MSKSLLEITVMNAQDGNSNAFAELYSLFKDDLYRFALYYLKNTDDAQDAVQEACCAAFENLKNLRKPSAFKSWLFKILANECKKMLSQKSSEAYTVLEDLPEDALGSDHSADASSLEVRELVCSLTDEERLIVFMSVVSGFKSREIAQALGLKPSSVRSKLSRSLAKLRAELEKTEVSYNE